MSEVATTSFLGWVAPRWSRIPTWGQIPSFSFNQFGVDLRSSAASPSETVTQQENKKTPKRSPSTRTSDIKNAVFATGSIPFFREYGFDNSKPNLAPTRWDGTVWITAPFRQGLHPLEPFAPARRVLPHLCIVRARGRGSRQLFECHRVTPRTATAASPARE